MRNLYIDWIRRRAAAPDSTAVDELALPLPEPQPVAWWELLDPDDVRALVAELPDELRRPLELFAFDGCSYQEIATRLRVPRCTIGTRIMRARRQLKDRCQAPSITVADG
jgi:RNA polymerase sigma-70 factor (ECF subfamily)